MTIKELKQLIENLPDNMIVIRYDGVQGYHTDIDIGIVTPTVPDNFGDLYKQCGPPGIVKYFNIGCPEY